MGEMKTHPPRILLADDNPAIRSALALLLETRLNVCIVGEVDNMENLLDYVTDYHPDIVILDWELPGLPKKERVAALKALHPAPVVVLTSPRPEIAQYARTAHADFFFCKSEPPEQVVRVIEQIKLSN
jgi:DNA-binding NarL/FixJ family response regulator